jgi:hypothetical protein
MSSTAPRGTDVKNKLPPNKTNNNKEIPAVPSGPTFPPSAVSNPGTIGTGPSFRPESNPNGSDFFGGIGSASFSSSLLLLVAVVVLCIRLIRVLDDAKGNLPQRVVVALLVVVANISLSLSPSSSSLFLLRVSVCLSFFSLLVRVKSYKELLYFYGADVVVLVERFIQFVRAFSGAKSADSGLFYSSLLFRRGLWPRLTRERR